MYLDYWVLILIECRGSGRGVGAHAGVFSHRWRRLHSRRSTHEFRGGRRTTLLRECVAHDSNTSHPPYPIVDPIECYILGLV